MNEFVLDSNESNLYEKAANVLRKFDYCVIKNFVDKKELHKKIDILKRTFSSKNDRKVVGNYRYKMPNFQRLDIGDYKQTNARFVRYLSQFTWNNDSLFLEETKKIRDFRNKVFNIQEENYIYHIDGTKYCDLPVLSHYPIGGGFQNSHTDEYNNEGGITNVLLNLTKRGEDYQSGGIYFNEDNGKIFDIEEILDVGDLYTHDIKKWHGVKVINKDDPLDMETSRGRWIINLKLVTMKF